MEAGGRLGYTELEKCVRDLKVSAIEKIGTKDWFLEKETWLKLYKEAVKEAAARGEERVVEAVLREQKLQVMVRELVTMCVWREKILEELLKLKPEPIHVFPTYIVLYHEVAVVGITHIALFHGVENLGESAEDLVDYCVGNLMKVLVQNEYKERVGTLEEIKHQRDILGLNISVQCIPILRFLAENFEKLPLSVASSVYENDVPLLVAHIILNDVFTKRGQHVEKYVESGWKKWGPDDPALSITECQIWLLIRQLLVSNACQTLYKFTNYRKETLCKLANLLHDNVLDQLSVLTDLRTWLYQVSMSAAPEGMAGKTTPLIMECSPKLKELLVSRYRREFVEIAATVSRLLFYSDREDVQWLANSLTEGFSSMEPPDSDKSCSFCYSPAHKKCSKCKKSWYCSRQCQVKHWNAHKENCL